MRQLTAKYGYPFENHTVQTDDGYILEIHRIPHGRSTSESEEQRPPVLIMPGAFCSSEAWINMGVENSLGFILADNGFDVWLANYRGTRWSRKHTSLNPDRYKDKNKYWTYSFQQIGYYDIPAFIDYILKQANQQNLFYVGHSQGTTSFFAFATDRPEYNNKIRLSTLLSPVAYAAHTTTPLAYLFNAFWNEIEVYLKITHKYEIFPYNKYQPLLATLFCSDRSPFQSLCAELYLLGMGYTPDQLNKTMLPVIFSTTPAGGSMRQFQHYIQLFDSKKFQKYDYGKKENIKRYGQATPPEYELHKVTAPVALFCGDTDTLAVIKDLDRTASELSNVVFYEILPGFNHVDVIWGIDAAKLIYNDLLSLMKKY